MMYFVQARHSSSGFWPSSLEGAVVAIGPLHLTAIPRMMTQKSKGWIVSSDQLDELEVEDQLEWRNCGEVEMQEQGPRVAGPAVELR
jgi:hypothetical protein